MIVVRSPQDKLLQALQSVAGIVERRHTLPVLANVLLRRSGPQLELTTSDLDIQVRTRAELEGDEADFATTVGARKLIDILRALPADQIVTLSAAQNKLTLQAGRSRFTLQTLPAEDFPLVNEAVDFGPSFAVPQKVLKGLIDQVHFAMAVHDIRYYLNGILFIAEGRTLTLVATDGHRLALAQAALAAEVPSRQEVILPRKTVLELQRLLRDEDTPIEMRWSPWPASAGCTKNAGVPVEASVAAILRPTWPLLPTPITTTRPRQANTAAAARAKSAPAPSRRRAASSSRPRASISKVRAASASARAASKAGASAMGNYDRGILGKRRAAATLASASWPPRSNWSCFTSSPRCSG
ncbi:MAG: hypothetical protein AMXMBFR66_34750 [Pseudomonadota bacterium]